MARRQEQQEDPWAGFVDVLSNIVMVVTFLVIILGIAIFALSQQITKKAVEQALAEVKKETAQPGAPPPAPTPAPGAKAVDPAAEKALEAAKAEIAELREKLAAAAPGTPPPPPPPAEEQVPKAALEEARKELAALKVALETAEAAAKAAAAAAPETVEVVKPDPATEAALVAAKAEVESLREQLAAAAPEAAPPPAPPPTVDQVPKEQLEAALKEMETLKQALEQARAEIEAPPAEKPTPGARPELTSPDGRTTAGDYRPAISTRLTQPDEVDGETNLTVRSRRDVETTEIVVAPESATVQQANVAVERSEAFVTLRFTKASFKLDEAASGQLQTYLGENRDVTENRVEIRAFASSVTGSITEARRIAYYRAMQVRNELVRSGVSAANVKVFVRESSSAEEADVVRLFAAP